MAAARHKFLHEGREIYQWDQELGELHVYITPPAGVKASMLDCKIAAKRVTLGLKGQRPFIDHELEDTVVVDESFWAMEDGELTITLTKSTKGVVWKCVFKGHGELDAAAEQEARRRLLLERFGEEHPGFDFRDAEVTGEAPDPASFMGGIKRV